MKKITLNENYSLIIDEERFYLQNSKSYNEHYMRFKTHVYRNLPKDKTLEEKEAYFREAFYNDQFHKISINKFIKTLYFKSDIIIVKTNDFDYNFIIKKTNDLLENITVTSNGKLLINNVEINNYRKQYKKD
jgi:hypothetical protein